MESKTRQIIYKIMLAFSVLCTIGAVLTLFPNSRASYPNIIGYKSLCTFAPAATFFCLLLAGISCFLRAALIKESGGSAGDKIKKHKKSFVPLTVVFAAAVISLVFFVSIKSRYTGSSASSDAVSAVSEEAE